MTFNLPALARQSGLRRNVTLRPINPTTAQATDLYAILRTALTPWQEATANILAGYDPAPLNDALTRDTTAQMTTAIDAAAAAFATRLVVQITPALRRWAVSVERWHRGKWSSAAKAGTGIDLTGFLLTTGRIDDTLEGFIARNVALAKDLSAQAQARISDAVYRGQQDGTPVRDVAREIADALDMGRKRTRRIAADQNQKLSGALDLERQAEAGLEQYRWRHSGKKHPREEHKARDGKLFPLAEPAGDRPGFKPFCGCRAQAWIPLVDETAEA
ncbi:phage head morphogenesis protein [Sphingomonas sp.]|uniref:phage head morphogenesis protein n=1 Tax=Sphingomonas sp. TaxID=28214 RepID=UPI003F70B0B9